MSVKSKLNLIVIILLSTVAFTGQTKRTALPAEAKIDLYIDINTPVAAVWKQWTTTSGLESFFAPSAKIELQPRGLFEMYFDPSAPVGQRGAEGNFILAAEENRMLSFTWDAPPDWPAIRAQRTSVVVRFSRLTERRTRLRFTQTGWGTSAEWCAVYDYFDGAWRKIVLPHLKYSLEVGALDWRDFPTRLPKNLPPAKRVTAMKRPLR